jgi:hypothetical protein
LWLDLLRVVLYPDRLVLARVSGGMTRHLVHKEILPIQSAGPGDPLWLPAVEAVGVKAADGAFALADVTLVLSSRFVRYVVVPWSDTLASREEELAFARHCFVRVYGDEARTWACKLSSARQRKPRLACAVERPLMDALNQRLGGLGRRYRSLQPHLMASFNRIRSHVRDQSAWLVVAEPGLLCLALLQDGSWQTVRTIAVESDWVSALPALLEREELLVDTETECSTVLVYAPDGPPEPQVPAGRWQIRILAPELLPGMVAGADSSFSIALGA